jgi:hypothetical protein
VGHLVDVLAFFIDHLTEVQTTLGLADQSLRTAAYYRAHLVLLPLSLFSRAMEIRPCMLCEDIPAAQEAVRQWSCIYHFFGESAKVMGCLDDVTAHF